MLSSTSRVLITYKDSSYGPRIHIVTDSDTWNTIDVIVSNEIAKLGHRPNIHLTLK